MSLAYKLLIDPWVVATVMILMAMALLIPHVTTAEAQLFAIGVIPVVVFRARQRGL